MTSATPRLKLINVSKTFPGVQAVKSVSLEAYSQQILALVGENGAGKSTLMNIINGVVQPDSGSIMLDGVEVRIDSPRRAQSLGITMIHQELALIPELTVGQNMFLGREPSRGGWIDWNELYRQTQQVLDRLGIAISARAKIAELSIAEQQLVEIARALSYQARLIALDEPTSSLTDRETEILFRLVRQLRAEGVALIYISHRMEEIFALADRIAVMRDGELITAGPASEFTPQRVVQLMVGRELQPSASQPAQPRGEPILRATNLVAGKAVRGVSLTLHRGEIVGMAGLVGAGRTNVARLLFGADRLDQGEIWFEGKPVSIRSPRDAIRLGIGLVTEDRKAQGLFLKQSVRNNAGAGLLERLSRFGFVNFRALTQQVSDLTTRLRVRTPSLNQQVRNLSGGNQQKVIIARWLALQPKVLILDEPTRGVDVGAKADIHALIRELAAQGMAILMISSELPEILAVSDRILVMREGRITAELNRAEATQDRIMQAAVGQE
ncbi:D-xylose ABC transporter ATP-binding protein [Chloroflexus islandicus]|uniref:D-xylose ABC transporter ATP-binding protein n=1 Tax=Chloroflexus islandicus TaxID=1707952 RepID=A0A178MDA5_9CHLR|nr:sugar ABC transporter ATP-binding protein [Chloroflexus islandicus]OAN46523.1 D-xylose ABC transporter ATP-binding protein [Chloroflexus islandicus]